MARFRHRSGRAKEGESNPEENGATEVQENAAADAAAQEVDAAPGELPDESVEPAEVDLRAHGPFDESEQHLADPDLPRLDLGSLRVPGLPGIGVQVEADPNTQQVRAVTAIAEGEEGAVQLQVFAAPKSEGLWDGIRSEMLADIAKTPGARVTRGEGAFGPELRARVPARSPDGRQVQQLLRFTGIDGPRWFLRAVFLGRAAAQPDPDDDLHRLVRETIVVRGAEAMAPGDPLPLRLPAQAVMAEEGDELDEELDEVLLDEGADEGADEDADDEQPNRFAGIDPFERGPEITEVR
jgi:hypothetical protein